MDSKEFKKFVVESAKKYILEGIDTDNADVKELDEKQKILKQPKLPKLTKPSFTKKDINKVPKIPKVSKEPKAPEATAIHHPKQVNEEICSPDKIKILAEEMKKINKKIDLRNPLISPELFDIIAEEKTSKETTDKEVIKEDNTERWKDLYNYNIPEDNSR